jgi:hypothetical protein
MASQFEKTINFLESEGERIEEKIDKPIKLGVEQPTQVSLDTGLGDVGFSYMAKRAYEQRGYASTEAYGAACMLSARFMSVVESQANDSNLTVQNGDELLIESGQATLTRHRGSKTETFVVSFAEELVIEEEREEKKEEIQKETRQAAIEIQDEIPSIGDVAPFVQDTDLARETLDLQDEEILLTGLGTQTLPEYPGYQFSNFSFGAEPYNTDWLIGYNPDKTAEFIVIDATTNESVGVAHNSKALKRTMEGLITDIKIKRLGDDTAKEAIAAIDEETERIPESSEEIVIDGEFEDEVAEEAAPEEKEEAEVKEEITVAGNTEPEPSLYERPVYNPTWSNTLDIVPANSPVRDIIETLHTDFIDAYHKQPTIYRKDTIATQRYAFFHGEPVYIEVSPGTRQSDQARYRVYTNNYMLTSGEHGWTENIEEVKRIAHQEIIRT